MALHDHVQQNQENQMQQWMCWSRENTKMCWIGGTSEPRWGACVPILCDLITDFMFLLSSLTNVLYSIFKELNTEELHVADLSDGHNVCVEGGCTFL